MMDIINIVATITTSKPFKLDILHDNLKNSEPAGKGANWLKMRLPNNEYVAFYESGKILITGAKSIDSIDASIEKIKTELLKNKIKITVNEVTIHNIVVIDKIKLHKSLETICIENKNLIISYEPEQFPGLIIYGDECTFLLFSSGKIISSGNKSVDSAENNMIGIKLILERD